MTSVRILVINMDRSIDRLAHIQQQANAADVTFEGIKGVAGTDVPHLRDQFLNPNGSTASTLSPAKSAAM